MKNIEHIKIVGFFDFDGTLIDTMEPNEGKKIWKEKTGKDYPHKGWWSKRETLDLEVFENKPFPDIVREYEKMKGDDSIYLALSTGRIIPLEKQVHAILNKYNLIFDEVVLNGDPSFTIKGENNDTINVKIRHLNELVSRFPNLEQVVIFDDRTKHSDVFIQWCKLQSIDAIYHHVKH